MRSFTHTGDSSRKRFFDVQRFHIAIGDRDMNELRSRLRSSRVPAGVTDEGGIALADMQEVVRYWLDDFDWRAQERALNRFEQFTTTIDGLTMHFIHRRSKQPGAFPLLITHGWPGSFVEFAKIIGPLTDPVAHGGRAEDAFDVVIPSIPGFAFSDKPREPGYDPARIGAIEAKLMARLGYPRYGVQGGDWGSIIGTQIALNDAPHVAGLHINMCTGAAPAMRIAAAAKALRIVRNRAVFIRARRIRFGAGATV